VSDCEKIGDYVMNIVEARLGKHLLSYNSLQLNLDKKTATIDGNNINLTRTEFALLHLLLVNRGKVLSRQQLMDCIWAGVIVTDSTVKVNITRLRKKLGPYAQNIVSHTGFGYLFEE
jgi:phosphate:Na+ symporter